MRPLSLSLSGYHLYLLTGGLVCSILYLFIRISVLFSSSFNNPSRSLAYGFSLPVDKLDASHFCTSLDLYQIAILSTGLLECDLFWVGCRDCKQDSVYDMSYSVKNSISDQEIANNGTRSAAANCCSSASSELKLYQAFIFSVPILFTFILLFLFYCFYLRRRRADWSSLRMRSSTNNSTPIPQTIDDLSMCELGVKKELREMLPIIVFNQSFSVKDTQCSVCLGDYQAEDRLQQIPGCGHTFHIECIDLWLTTHTTCPLCRKSLLSTSKPPDTNDAETNATTCNAESHVEAAAADSQNSSEDPQTSGSTDEAVVPEVGQSDIPDLQRRHDEVVRPECEMIV